MSRELHMFVVTLMFSHIIPFYIRCTLVGVVRPSMSSLIKHGFSWNRVFARSFTEDTFPESEKRAHI